ncbi:MAG: DUF4159 domain-containing protein [Chthoniobacter sp.]|nr:DUF4159 domain-containing protein [Chthoniobacter sp.]
MNATTFHSPHMQAKRKPFSTALIEYFSKAQFFTLSALLHAALILLLGGTVLVKHIVETPDFTSEPGTLVNNEQLVKPPPEQTPQLQNPDASLATPEISNVPMAPSAIASITTTNLTTSSFNMSSQASTMPAMKSDMLKAPMAPKVPTTGTGLSKDIAKRIANFTSGWSKGGTAAMSKPLKSREFVFTAYLAKYQGGDWDSTVRLEPDGRIWAGSLPNLLYIITKLSKKKITAEPQVEPLDLSSDEIFVKKPPFIWFTGHRDFKLTDKEVENLGEYLRRGGCIWGDSSLPGQRSRFDIAFRREMLRLVPDPNQPWKELPASHPIFTHAWYSEVKAVAPGVNFYDEPIYALMGYGGEIAVLYTANDYGDMWQFGIDEKGDIDLSRDEKKRMVAVNEEMWYRRNLYYRNIEPKALFDTYKFGTNIIIHLLTRWEEKLRNVPQMEN